MNYSFKKFQPVSLRVWHWFNALVILGLLATVFLRKTFLSWRANAALIENRIQEAGGTIEVDVAKKIAQTMRDQMWDWHYILGYAMGAFLLIRVLIGIFVKKECPATHAAKSALSLAQVPPETKIKAIHYTLVKSGYALFYLVSLFMVLSGLAMHFEEALHVSEGLEDVLKETHELLMWFFVVFVVGHILGVVIAELRGDQGLVSDMINGGKKD
ncbi:cytochrome b/b6 domain-containing protein [Bdellovibrio svalbardensis]|uniref:Cytochrome b/b6 domain-containing protein n=1 Tax=Bdellovibrio svalbardensis TaxID=2972972 RepID=A0ABT6DM89_9BACT|nr:cytochrome b/b6 domain-containing protein [Bdellovibrio svalbardensis]MDG0817607.1 cytochrome b/b6 domain-containing protein [Bdellovibrio svalbardensis]